MTNLTLWVLALVEPLLGRILAALGFAVITIAGFDVVITQLKQLVITHLGSVPYAALQLVLLSGIGTAMGMVFGAITTKLVIWQLQNAKKILGKTS